MRKEAQTGKLAAPGHTASGGPGLPAPKHRPVPARHPGPPARAALVLAEASRVSPAHPTAPLLFPPPAANQVSHTIPFPAAHRLPPLLLMALPGLVPSRYLLGLQRGWSGGWAPADTGHGIIRGTSLPPRARTTSAWPPHPHPKGLCLGGHSLFTDHRNGGFQGRVIFPTDCEHKGNWRMLPGHTPTRSATRTKSDTWQEVMPSCPSGHVRHVS